MDGGLINKGLKFSMLFFTSHLSCFFLP
uniref:Uncharacterized protein n=1 Tax=Lepeophtheirus salmonis TaxID=72036 RepID=A0A0K2TC65_LEPSM